MWRESWLLLLPALVLSCAATDDPGSSASGGSAGSAAGGGSDAGWPSPDGASGGGAGGAGGAPGGSGGVTDAAADVDAGPVVTQCTPVGAVDCSASTAPSYECGEPSPAFDDPVNAAIELVLAQHPEWFDPTQGPAACCPLALEPKSFVDAVVAAVNAGGLCAQIDPNNPAIEIVVKHDNACSEQYVLLTSANIVRHPPKFQATCSPAWL